MLKRGTLPALIAATIFAAAFLLANIPGNLILGPAPLSDGPYGSFFFCGVSEVAHGWPMTVLRHDGDVTPPGMVISAWRIGDNVRFSPAALLVNLALLAAGTVLVGWLVGRRLRGRGWQFTLFDVLTVTLSVSLVAALAALRYRTHQAQVARCELAGSSFNYAERQPFGPYWLRNITGPQYWEWGDLQIAVDVVHSDEIAELPGKSTIKVLRIENVQVDAMPSLDGYDSLQAIHMGLANYASATYTGDGDPPLLPCLRQIARCESIQALNLYDSTVTDRCLQELSQMPNLIGLELADNREITDAGLEYLASLTRLRKLGLVGTGVSQEGVERLQARLPECEIHWK